jgi:ubiquinone/menaquinone biosynthesis C-methylase UbiE
MSGGFDLATDIAPIIESLCRFYDFGGKTVISAGAGGGQFVDFARRTRKIVAVDQDSAALELLKTRVESEGLADSYDFVRSDFNDMNGRGDVVLFEFCLHEMPDPFDALRHARTLAPDIVVIDHWPGSEWLYCVVEEDKVQKSTEAMRLFGVRSQAVFQAEQLFKNHAELVAKVSIQGPEAVHRAGKFRGVTDIVIPMAWAATLL